LGVSPGVPIGLARIRPASEEADALIPTMDKRALKIKYAIAISIPAHFAA
jgi:hypothetical protein